MQGTSAVVTGGARGLGLAIAEMLGSRGARIALIDLDAAALEAAVAALDGKGIDAAPVAGDIRRQAGAQAAFAKAAEAVGRVHVLINNAGVYPRRPLLEIDDEAWDHTFDVNLRGLYHMSVAAVRHMQPFRSGRIVNISSVDAYIPYPKNAHYAAAKAGVVSLTKSFAAACAPDQILVNSVAPAAIATDQLKSAGLLSELAALSPLGRAAEPPDIAEIVCFLASDANRFITGETVIASGGFLMA